MSGDVKKAALAGLNLLTQLDLSSAMPTFESLGLGEQIVTLQSGLDGNKLHKWLFESSNFGGSGTVREIDTLVSQIPTEEPLPLPKLARSATMQARLSTWLECVLRCRRCVNY